MDAPLPNFFDDDPTDDQSSVTTAGDLQLTFDDTNYQSLHDFQPCDSYQNELMVQNINAAHQAVTNIGNQTTSSHQGRGGFVSHQANMPGNQQNGRLMQQWSGMNAMTGYNVSSLVLDKNKS
jgi:hypothetical protein